MDIKGKTALVTGGANGIGYQYVIQLLKKGAKSVAVWDLPNSKGEESVAKLVKEFGAGRATFYVCDVTDREAVKTNFKKVWESFNGLDILINNAGFLNETKWEAMLDLNVRSLIDLTQLALDHMAKPKGGKGGTIVNVASIVGLTPFGFSPIYTASKHAVIGFSRAISQAYPKTGVRILVMCPGVSATPLILECLDKISPWFTQQEVTDFFTEVPPQPTELVADSLMKLLEEGENGAIWVSEKSLPPYAVHIPCHDQLKAN